MLCIPSFKVNVVLQQHEHSKNRLFLQTQSPSSPINTNSHNKLLQNHTRTKTSSVWCLDCASAFKFRPKLGGQNNRNKVLVQSKLQSSTRSYLPFLGWQVSVEIQMTKPRHTFLLANIFIVLCDESIGQYVFIRYWKNIHPENIKVMYGDAEATKWNSTPSRFLSPSCGSKCQYVYYSRL